MAMNEFSQWRPWFNMFQHYASISINSAKRSVNDFVAYQDCYDMRAPLPFLAHPRNCAEAKTYRELACWFAQNPAHVVLSHTSLYLPEIRWCDPIHWHQDMGQYRETNPQGNHK
jgi:hypothetical protein